VHGVGVEMKNDLSWVKRTYFIFNIILNKWIPGRLRTPDTIKETLSRATNTFLQCQKNITSTYFLHVCRKIYKL
jgi:hypothetical protein